eukprot:CAMPEP_0194508390 /NCGR_PEP_ID=MMETSP0253-20130528/38582_1 /TAXON_ID=2966 /ORGANISM="Noctiluca scintillans" /LENGTH=155 /DNA_ID=CAMNT_0039351421 /DNA_START=1 /DNA_END=464 /DNA_ORIENTATION=+
MVESAAAALEHDTKIHKEPAQLSQAECAVHAVGEKMAGNTAFANENWETAIGRYQEGLRYCLYAHSHHGDALEDETKNVTVTLLSNSAAARLKQGKFELAVEDCTKALCFDMFNVKVYFRRAQARSALGDFDHAIEDALRILDLDPDNKEANLLR